MAACAASKGDARYSICADLKSKMLLLLFIAAAIFECLWKN